MPKKDCERHEKKRGLRCRKCDSLEVPCVFWENVACTFKRYRPNICLNERCPHYQRWKRMMDEKDEREDAEVNEILSSGVHPDDF